MVAKLSILLFSVLNLSQAKILFWLVQKMNMLRNVSILHLVILLRNLTRSKNLVTLSMFQRTHQCAALEIKMAKSTSKISTIQKTELTQPINLALTYQKAL